MSARLKTRPSLAAGYAVKQNKNSAEWAHCANLRVNSSGSQEVQAAYIRKVVDTVNDLDNVLYEVINEGGEKEWNWWVVQTILDYEATKPRQHPVGITGHGAEGLDSMLASPAEWVSPGTYLFEWFNPSNSQTAESGRIESSGEA